MPHPAAKQLADAELQSAEAKVLGTIMVGVADDVHELRNTAQAIHQRLERLGVIEQQQQQNEQALGRAFSEIKDLREKVEPLVRDHPQLMETRKWVIAGILGGLSMMGIALGKLVFYDPSNVKPPVIYIQPQAFAAPESQQPIVPAPQPPPHSR